MIRINLLPHREMRREKRKKDYITSMVIAGVAGAVLVFAGGVLINQQIEAQTERNTFIRSSIDKLDIEIAEIKSLQEAITSLKARQTAVENLQSDRTIPVHLFDELVKLMPEGVFLERLVQTDLKVTLKGLAQSNERVAELLRNLSDRSEWMESPNLDEIKELIVRDVNSSARTGDVRRAYEFTLNVLVKRRSVATPMPGAAPAKQAQLAPLALGGRQDGAPR